MSDPVDTKAFLNLCEMAIDNMYELQAIGELLEQKGVMTKDEIIALAKELKRKTPPTESRTASTPSEALSFLTQPDVLPAWPTCSPQQCMAGHIGRKGHDEKSYPRQNLSHPHRTVDCDVAKFLSQNR